MDKAANPAHRTNRHEQHLQVSRWGRRKAMKLAAGPATRTPSAGDLEIAQFVALIFKHFKPRLGRVPLFDDATLRRLTMPVMLVAGGRDALLDAHDSTRRLMHGVPRATAHHFDSEGTHLQRYARLLRCAEINSSFHRPHAVTTYARWAASTPSGFRFAVKLPRTITHDQQLKRARPAVERF